MTITPGAVEAPPYVPPAYHWVPEHTATYGGEAIDLAHEAGLTLDVEQEEAINSIMACDASGAWAAPEAAIIEPRQNGKTDRIIVPVTLADLFLFPPDEIMHTAHRFKTSSKTFAEFKRIIDGCHYLRRRVKKIKESHGEESIELLSGASLLFLARSKSGGRGLGGKRINLDEAFALQPGQIGAILPVLLARRDVQVLYASSAGLADSADLRELRDRGRSLADPDLVYIERCAPGSWEEPGCASRRCNHHRSTSGCALDCEENWRTANHAYPRRISKRNIRLMRKAMTPLEFGREILGWWDIPRLDDVSPITADKWGKCADPKSSVIDIRESMAIGFDVAPDRQTAAIAVAGTRNDGIFHGELVRYSGMSDALRVGDLSWVVDEIVRLKSKLPLAAIMVGKERRPAIICDPAGPAGSLVPDLQHAGIEPVLMTARMMAAACGGLQDAVNKGPSQWRHLGQAQVDLAVEGASRRDIGDGGWAFGRKRSADSAVDICPLVAVTVARWGLTVAAPPVAMPRVAWG